MEVGITAGAFDLFHAGHVLMLKDASNQCDYLIVALQTDPTIDRKEKNKPIQTMYERFIQLNACKYVDEVIPYETEDDLYTLIMNNDVDVRIIGNEYRNEDFTAREVGMDIYYNARNHRWSTSELRERILDESF
jgi:glycerol-3-phosphate cytidylyltransferase|tara:strand:+ start:291 stop:692 length:402 start_codon:yes stop_codon:yes gene_type:complete